MPTYYNDNDPYCCEWLRNLIAAGHLPAGDVDERSIAEVSTDDIKGYTHAHFFAGIGGWPLALKLAGWPDDRPVWTGSCPCQPFSAAGKKEGIKDDRHLWPEWFRLIRSCRPDIIFGEQVASAEVVGTKLEAAFVIAVREGEFARANAIAKQLTKSRSFHYWPRWIDLVCAEMEAIGYTLRTEILGAHSVGAPHIRQRLWFVADGLGTGLEIEREQSARHQREATERSCAIGQIDGDAYGRDGFGSGGNVVNSWSDLVWLPCTDGKQRPTGRLVNAESEQAGIPGCSWQSGEAAGQRAVEPIIQPLAHGVPARVAKLRAAGNAIVPQVAAEFIKAARG